VNPETGIMESKELHHQPVPQRQGGKEFMEVWPDQHAEVDKYRRLKKR
jgi:filamentous hemagglutinin